MALFLSVLLLSVALKALRAIDCEDGWFEVDDHCYYQSEQKVSFEEAKRLCEKMSSHLLVPEKEEELNCVNKKICFPCRLWLGMNYTDKPTWSSGMGVAVNKLPWLNNENDYGHLKSLDCVAFYKVSSASLPYVDWYKCESKFNYVCKRAENAASVTSASKAARHVSNFEKSAVDGAAIAEDIDKTANITSNAIGVDNQLITNNTDPVIVEVSSDKQ